MVEKIEAKDDVSVSKQLEQDIVEKIEAKDDVSVSKQLEQDIVEKIEAKDDVSLIKQLVDAAEKCVDECKYKNKLLESVVFF